MDDRAVGLRLLRLDTASLHCHGAVLESQPGVGRRGRERDKGGDYGMDVFKIQEERRGEEREEEKGRRERRGEGGARRKEGREEGGVEKGRGEETGEERGERRGGEERGDI